MSRHFENSTLNITDVTKVTVNIYGPQLQRTQQEIRHNYDREELVWKCNYNFISKKC